MKWRKMQMQKNENRLKSEKKRGENCENGKFSVDNAIAFGITRLTPSIIIYLST